jgi:hypothetical protein
MASGPHFMISLSLSLSWSTQMNNEWLRILGQLLGVARGARTGAFGPGLGRGDPAARCGGQTLHKPICHMVEGGAKGGGLTPIIVT